MAKKLKNGIPKLAHSVPLGPERHDKIKRFCGRIESETGNRPTIPEAVNQLLDRAFQTLEV